MKILLIVLAIAIAGSIIALVFLLRKKKYETFVINNSKALDELTQLNDKYEFYDIKEYTEKHTYDNKVFYNGISCEDYLIYQLQFKQKDVYQQLKKVSLNKSNYSNYSKELSDINCFDEYYNSTDKYNKKYLSYIEAKLFEYYTKEKPITEFKINVILHLSNINGVVYKSKGYSFNEVQIKTYISRLHNRSGFFYNDKGIWDSICRVERGKVSNKMRFSIYKRDGYRCRICGRTRRYAYLEIDHIKPIAKGGKSTYDNLQTLCKRCNQEKGDKY